MEIYCVKEVEQNPLPKSQTKPFYIGTKEAPSDTVNFTLAQFCKYTCMYFAIYHKCTQDILMERVHNYIVAEHRTPYTEVGFRIPNGAEYPLSIVLVIILSHRDQLFHQRIYLRFI